MKSILKSRVGAVSVGAIILVLGSATTGAIAATVITGANIKDGTVTGVDIKNGSLTGTDVLDGSVKGIDVSGLTGSDLVDGSITGVDVKGRSLTASDIASNSITTNEIKDGTLSFADANQEFLDALNAKPDYVGHAFSMTTTPTFQWGAVSEPDGSAYTLGGIDPSQTTKYLVNINVVSTLDHPVQVSLNNRNHDEDRDDVRCIAVPVQGFPKATCTGTGMFVGGTGLMLRGFSRDGEGTMLPIDSSKVTVQITIVTIYR